MEYILIALGIVVIVLIVVFLTKKQKPEAPPENRVEIKPEDIATMAAYIKAQQEEEIEAQLKKELKKAENKEKLEVYRQTKEQLRDKLKGQIDAKEWRPLEALLRSADKGGTGIYILYNETKNKYYVGQAKQIYKRVRDHFAVEDITRDFLSGDKIQVKILTANELDADYRLDHIEKTGIEIFNADKSGYNKTTGNL